MVSKVYNLMWVAPRFKVSDEGAFFEPVPELTVKNIRNIAATNSDCDVLLWVDSERLATAQMSWLKKLEQGNLQIKDLREIEEYRDRPLYNDRSYDPNWRTDKEKYSLIWRVVDAARVLVCLHTKYDQVFYSDADVDNFRIGSDEVQEKMTKYGFVFSGNEQGVENQMFGFTREKTDLLEILHSYTTSYAVRGRNGYAGICGFMEHLRQNHSVEPHGAFIDVKYDGTQAEEHPDSLRIDGGLWRSEMPAKGSGFAAALAN